MNVETELCKNLKTLFQALLPGVEIIGNWIPDNATKGLEPYAGARLDISVSGRRHESYSSPIAETTVNLDLSIALESDTTLDAMIEAHERISALLEEWHRSLAAAKRDLAVGTLYSPVGLRVVDSGTLTLDSESKTRNLTHQFTIKGRISQS